MSAKNLTKSGLVQRCYRLARIAQVVTGRAYEIPHVLDKKQVDGGQVPALERAAHHAGVPVAGSGRGDLPHGEFVAGQAACIGIGLYVLRKDGNVTRTYRT